MKIMMKLIQLLFEKVFSIENEIRLLKERIKELEK
jgi:hypothetical protein